MPAVSLLAKFFFTLLISFTAGITEVRFAGQTEFVVNETNTTIIRLVIERTGAPANITAIVSLQGVNTGDFVDSVAAAYIPDIETNRTIYISVYDDVLPEADEIFYFNLTLLTPSTEVKLGSPISAKVTILSNDNAFGIISFNMSSLITVNEPKGRNLSVPFMLIREKGTYGAIVVTLEIEGGPNLPEEDLSPVKANLTFPPGTASLIYNLTVLDDQIPENDELFSILLSNAVGGAEINSSRNTVQINIRKNDSPVRFIQSSYLVPEREHTVTIPVTRGKDESGAVIGPDDSAVSIRYAILTGNSTAHAQLDFDFLDLQPNATIVIPPQVYESAIRFQIINDDIPEIAESFQVMLLENTLQGDAVLLSPFIVQVTIEPNDKPNGVLSISSAALAQAIILDEDQLSRFESISVVRNGGTHGNVSVSWVISRNSTDPSPVTADIVPATGVLHFFQGQMLASIPLTIINDNYPEEAEAYLLQILGPTVEGGAEVGKPAELLFYIQDSDDVYGLIMFHPEKQQRIESNPGERFLSLTFLRQGGKKGDVRLIYSALYIPAGTVDPVRAKDGVLNVSRRNSVLFQEELSQVAVKLPIRNDAFLQNGAHFLIQLEAAELVNITPLIPSVSPRLGDIQNISLKVTPDIANGEIGFISNLSIIVNEPENFSTNVISIVLHRDGTDGVATVFWSLKPSGLNPNTITFEDLSPFNGSVTFLPGQSDTEINITVKADDIPEVNETAIVSLDRVSVENQILKSGFTSCEIIILENDDPGGVFEFSPATRGPYSIREGESVELRIRRSKGVLVKQFLRYTIEPRDSDEFYGKLGILEFKPGENEIVITLLTRKDGIPELDETYSVVLSSHSELPSTLGAAIRVNITILKNDDPHGVIEFITDELIGTIKETKGEDIFAASFGVIRNMGRFGNVSVTWVVNPGFTNDVFPVQGTIPFGDQEFSKNITIYSLPDEIPEDMETFTITLLNTTGGARMGTRISSRLQITRNDDPIYFADPLTVRIQEGKIAKFTVMRNGSTDFASTVMYATVDGGATAEDGDFIPSSKGSTILFDVGEKVQNISVLINDDNVPETDEPFYIVLFNATGDTVVYASKRAVVIIEANDDPNGIFFLEPIDKTVEEGKTNDFMVVRHRGNFGNVSVAWRLFENDSALRSGQEFYETSGMLWFMDGEAFKPITLLALPDKIPEFNELYTLKLVNISGGYPGPGGQLAETMLNVTVMIPFNDDPFGVFVVSPESQDREIAEDTLSRDDLSYITSFSIWRQQGTFGEVRVGWELLSSPLKDGFPPVFDFLLLASFPRSVQSSPHLRRHHSGTDALYFNGAEDAFGIVRPEFYYGMNNSLRNFTFSAWVMPDDNTDGFIIAKGNDNGTLYYGVKIQTNDSYVALLLYYITLASNVTHVAKTVVLKYLEAKEWLHFLITLDDGIIEFYFNGNLVPGGMKNLKGEAIADGPGTLRVGAGVNNGSRYTGLMQDVRLYERKLSQAEINELHNTPAKADLYPVSGYLEYRQGESNKSFIVSAKDDDDEEGEELFVLKLVSVCGGARLAKENITATLRIQKSDNANGLFRFTGPCIPEVSDEGTTISCVVERTRGALDYVYVFYVLSQIDSTSMNYSSADFANSSGVITFLPSSRYEVLNLHILDDDIPELAEHFSVALVSAVPGDRKTGSVPTSGASIDPQKKTTNITIRASDHPYGLLQFSVGPPPQPDSKILPASTIPKITVKEEIGEVKLLVVRAQGLLGRVMVDYRTVSVTAFSPEDYTATSGTLEFRPGERYKYISVNITDDSVPELEKYFQVELLNAGEGVAELFRSDGSGSGDGDMEFFLPAVHQQASLGIAAHIIVTIEASDDAHGVFEFSSDSLNVIGTEPEGGFSTLTLQVLRLNGDLSQVTLYWSIDSDPSGDLVSNYGSVTFGRGQRRNNITVRVSPDEVPELDERFSVLITNVSSGRLGIYTNATLTILASDDPYGLFIFSETNRPIRVLEALKNVSLTIVRLNGLLGIVMVTYRTMDVTDKSFYLPPNVVRAMEGKDYLPISGAVVFAANMSEATIILPILDDDEPERAESVFVELLNATLVKGVQNRSIVDSPRLGPKGNIIAQIIINANDDAFGVLQLSARTVRVAENYVGPIINVTRTGGMFADVSVKFKAVPMTATAGEDYSVASTDVVLLDGETSKSVPIYIINDISPELEESFLVELLNQTTGGALLGDMMQAVIIIEASDDPYGSFVFQITTLTIDEPEFSSMKVELPVIRNSGTLGNVIVHWVATINGQLATGDLHVASGNVTFAPGEIIRSLWLEILADDIPEIEEVVRVRLTEASNGGSIGIDGVANIIIPPNDNPYGTVSFQRLMYRVQEPLEKNTLANITVKRSAGRFGRLQILYSTSEVDVVVLAKEQGLDALSYYELPVEGIPNQPSRTVVNVSAAGNPLDTCATLCLKEQNCSAFSFLRTSGIPQCFWWIAWSNLKNNTGFWTYRKNSTRVSALFSTQAKAGSDYESITGQWATMLEGEEFANLTVSILTDSWPELDEKFTVSLLSVELMNTSTSFRNQPTIGQPNTSIVVIMMNGDAFGVFLMYIVNPNATNKGLYLEVQEQPQTTLQLAIERRDGSMGRVTVEWNVVGGTATRNLDFEGDFEILTFAEGETRKMVTLKILDDSEPEDNETIIISLTQTDGGSRILPSSATVTVVILANDNPAGVISFQAASRSIIGHEGEKLHFHVLRTAPGLGNVTVSWRIIGQHLEQNFANSTGVLFFPEGFLNSTFSVHLLDDQIPEEKEEYQLVLYNVQTKGLYLTGAAVLDSRGFEAALTVEASDQPYGVLSFAPSSRIVFTQEGNKTIQLFINREFGSLGIINVTYTTVPGRLGLGNQTEGHLAEPGVDFVAVFGSLLLQKGETAAAINITILEDDIPELQEFFLVNLTSVELVMKPQTSFPPRLDVEGMAAQIIIEANDGVKGVIEWRSTNFEINETHGILTLVVFRNRGTYGNVSLLFYAQNLGAHIGKDFNVSTKVLSFAEGERYKYIDITIFDDDIPEGDEKFQLVLANPSPGLELGQNTTATVTIFANDDGHGILSFNNTDPFLLREPSALFLSESIAELLVIREPPQGIFGTVTVQFLVTGVNASDASGDLDPSQGYIVLEEGVRFKTLQITAILDEDSEMDEHFVVTLYGATGGARLGNKVQTRITILQNQAPQGLFSIFPVTNRTNSLSIEEGNWTIYLKVSRSNGLNMSVSVEWETLSGTAIGIKGENTVLSITQSFPGKSFSRWCFFHVRDSLYGILLRTSVSPSTIYQWQGVFVPVEDFQLQNPQSCMAFNMNGSQYLVITHKGTQQTSSINSIYSFTPGARLQLVQMLPSPEISDMKHFTADHKEYLVIASQMKDSDNLQVFRWNNGSFVLHQKLPTYETAAVAIFTRNGATYMAVSLTTTRQNSMLYQWSGTDFRNPQEIPINGAIRVDVSISGAGIYLIFAKESNDSSEVFLWETGQPFFRHFQSLPFNAINWIHSFIPPSGLVHLLLAGKNASALYSWSSAMNRFSLLLEAPPANHLASSVVRSFNTTKSLIAASGESGSQIYELTTVSNQSDFIPSSGELKFEPGDREAIIAINVLDDLIPEEEESFRVRLKNPRGGAEIGANGYVMIIILTNDDAHGVIAFTQSSLSKQVEELEEDNLVTFSIERLKGTYGRVAVEWIANGSISDVFPASGLVTFSEGQALATITLTVLADSIAELTETVTLTLTGVTTLGVVDPKRGAIIDPKRAKAVLTILPNDAPYGVVGWHPDFFFVKVAEPDGNSSVITLQIVREQGFVGDIAVHVISKPNFSLPPTNQATENQDYLAKDEIIIIAENKTGTWVNVTILPDNIPELFENFIINLTDARLGNSSLMGGQPSVKRLGAEIVEISIEENDEPRGIFQFNVTKGTNGAVSGYELPPPQNILRLPIVRKAGRFGLVSLYWKATPATASLEDFSPLFGNLTFADGQALGSIEITIVDDTEIEFLETFNVTLIRVTGGAKLGEETVVIINIPPNDSPVGIFGFEEKLVKVHEPQASGDPNGLVSLAVVRSPGGRGAVKILWILEEAAKHDLSPLNGTLLFNETESRKNIILRAIQDGVLEGDERYTIQLLSADNSEISPVDGIATVIILGDQGASGIVGIASLSSHILIGEPSGRYNGTALVNLVRGPGIFGEITVFWNITPPLLKEFAETSGSLKMQDRQSAAIILLEALDDVIPEEKRYYQFQLTGISGGGIINDSANWANITMAASDYPYGQFAFSQEVLQTSEEEKQVTLTVTRSSGSIGQVRLSYQTLNGSAVGGMDFTSLRGELLFLPNETSKIITVEIQDDDLPEGPEEFFIMITKAELQGSGFDFTIRENGLQVDQPPGIGNFSVIRVVIRKNDNVEGVIEFDPQFIAVQVEEDIGVVMIPVVRKRGTFGYVTADFVSHSISALPDGVDYNITNHSVVFHHGQNWSSIYVSITNDDEREFAEQFEIQLIGATGGAVLGLHLVSRVTIAKSDSPNGLVRFLNQSRIMLPNPNISLALTLVLERVGGALGETQVNWNILGPNSREVLPPLNSDIGDPVNGSFHFTDGEGGLRFINLKIYPHEEIEVRETFIVKLTIERGESEIDPKAGNITLIIQNFGDPNGIVQFAAESLSKKNYSEPVDGPLNITLFVKRVQGTMGNITVYWELKSDSDIAGDFLSTSGSVTIASMWSTAEIIIQLLPDDVPEVNENCLVQLVSVEGGAELDPEKSFIRFTILANDDPHGVFILVSSRQSVSVTKDMSRFIQINVTRLAGLFGNVTVEFQISSGDQEEKSSTGKTMGSLLIRDGANYGVSTVPVDSWVFLSPGSNFTVELTSVKLAGGDIYGVPQILKEKKSAAVPVPDDAANSEVGFESVVFWLTNITAGTSQVVISRKGLYGSLIVSWRSGYPPDLTPTTILSGNITPEFGMVPFSHGEQRQIIPLLLTASTSTPEAFALQLISVSTNVSGGARLRSGFTVADIEPMGVFQFAQNSRHVVVEEDVQVITLLVQRLYGFHGNKTKVMYQTIAGSAKPADDFEAIENGELLFSSLQTDAVINISINNDKISEMDEIFYLNLTSVEVVGNQKTNPRLNSDFSIATITVLANDATSGIFSLGPAFIYAEEDSNTVDISVKRSQGYSGVIKVMVKTFGRTSAQAGVPFEISHHTSNLTWATEGLDFEAQTIPVTLLDGEREHKVTITIWNDDEPEGQEMFYVFLADPEGGAQIVDGKDENGFTSFAVIVITGNDLQNGILGFSMESQYGQKLDEDSENRTVQLMVTRQANRAFEDVTISWRVTFNRTTIELHRDGVDLVNELLAVSGTVTCTVGQTKCCFSLEIKSDKIPEFETYFFVELYEVSAGAALNNSTRFANITILESDAPHGLIYFAVGSRMAVAHKKTTLISLQVSRDSNIRMPIDVGYNMQELEKAETVGRTLISPAIAGKDFVRSDGVLTFEAGQQIIVLYVNLTPELGSPNPFPKRFQIVLADPTEGAKVSEMYGTANVTIVSDPESQSLWGMVDQLYQPLDDTILDSVLQNLNKKAATESTEEQLGAVINIMDMVTTEGEKHVLSSKSRSFFYDILCSLSSPNRRDTHGYSQLAATAEKFAFSLLTGTICGSPGERGKTILDSCPYLAISAYHWYPQQINGHKFDGKSGDFFRVPERFLEVPLDLAIARDKGCKFVHFMEYSSQQWFLTRKKETALNSKIFSVSLKDQVFHPLTNNNVVIYRIYAAGSRIVQHKSRCLLWSLAEESWVSDGQFCKVVDDASDYVECACSHMSIYAVYAQIDNLSSYNEAFFSAGFICISGFTLAILSNLFCSSRCSMFAAKLLTHMMVTSLGTQVSFLTSAYASRELSEESCSALGSITHFLYLCQFSWMLIQAVNFWYVLVMNDEHMERRYLLFFTLSWGLPALIVILLLVILRGVYHWSMSEIYGLVHNDMCFIPNVYVALFTAALVPLVCLVVVFVVFIHAYQVTPQWKAYDDVFRGRTNAAEIPLVLYLFALISVTWLWGGLHLAYRHLWMLILFVIFNSLQGLYVFVVYFILHNQLCCPVKASYSIETNGHAHPSSTFFTASSGLPPAGGEISKSTQNLISAMEEVPIDWEMNSQIGSDFKHSPQNGNVFSTTREFSNGSLVAEEESQEFDDLIFALKAGSGLNVSDSESCHGSQDGGSTANSQIVELRRIPIADTHL
ncbi:adhesion G-protein coupled receptor V1 [Rhinatrema bivittatum]|uniref:adhesion G-protein coupled receptor V1 n=1 Tax=Rhinatrema bivittatum TaxID=194408 RepID=UPI00112D3524|nr:adhesion G-protein coupled receptor V1 [Rhinatrema bivittatum]